MSVEEGGFRSVPATRTRAIVLRAIDYGESDRILGLLTRDFGKLSVFARGARKSKRRFAGVDLFSAFDAEIDAAKIKRGGFCAIDSVDNLEQNLELRADLFALCQASYLAECTWLFMGELDAHPGFFEWWSAVLARLRSPNQGADAQVLMDLEMLRWFGYLPSLRHCIECGTEMADQNVFFAFSKGGIVCRSCHRADSGRWMSTRDLQEGKVSALRSTLDAFVRHTLGREPKSQRVREEICYGNAASVL